MVFETTALKSTKAMGACAAGYEVFTAAVQVAGGVGERQRSDSHQLTFSTVKKARAQCHTQDKTKKKKSLQAPPPSI